MLPKRNSTWRARMTRLRNALSTLIRPFTHSLESPRGHSLIYSLTCGFRSRLAVAKMDYASERRVRIRKHMCGVEPRSIVPSQRTVGSINGSAPWRSQRAMRATCSLLSFTQSSADRALPAWSGSKQSQQHCRGSFGETVHVSTLFGLYRACLCSAALFSVVRKIPSNILLAVCYCSSGSISNSRVTL